MDSYGTHKTEKVRAWFAARPRYHVHFTPTSASWVNLVERFFGLISERWIKRNSHRMTRELPKTEHRFDDTEYWLDGSLSQDIGAAPGPGLKFMRHALDGRAGIGYWSQFSEWPQRRLMVLFSFDGKYQPFRRRPVVPASARLVPCRYRPGSPQVLSPACCVHRPLPGHCSSVRSRHRHRHDA